MKIHFPFSARLSVTGHINDCIRISLDVDYVQDEYDIDADQLKLLEVLGEGAFGIVYKGILLPESRKDEEACQFIVAVKVSLNNMPFSLVHALGMDELVGSLAMLVIYST